MTQFKQVYKCNVCGNIVEVLHVGGGELVCCDQPMELQEEKNQDEGLEKHTPVIEETENGILVKVGSMAHPMEESHFIEWIEIIVNDKRHSKKFLKSGDEPRLECKCGVEKENVQARAYCNVHGLWKS